MAVLVEANSVIIKCSSIEQKFPGGRRDFERRYGHINMTYCCDSELCRFGFMTPDDTDDFLSSLARDNLIYIERDIALDIVVADHIRGLEISCEWIRLGRAPIDNENGNKIVTYAELTFSKISGLAIPLGWDYDDSLTKSSTMTLPSQQDKMFRFLRTEGNNNVYLNLETGKEAYVARSRKERQKSALQRYLESCSNEHAVQH